MTWTKRSLLAVALGAVLLPAAAQGQVLQGLGLNHPELRDLFVSCPGCADTAVPGAPASVKGAQNGYAPGSVFGRFQGGVPDNQPRVSVYIDSRYPNSGSSPRWTSGDLPGTLLPAFASGGLALVQSTSPYSGIFLQALLYEPDQVKRKTTAKQSSIKLKQNGSIAIRRGTFFSTYQASSVSVLALPDCKAQADIKLSEVSLVANYKMKLRCSGKSTEVESLKQDLAEFFGGKPKNGFDLKGDSP